MNVIGWGIVDARRVMDLAEADMILAAASFAEPIKHDVPELHYVGIYNVKWGTVTVFNYYVDGKFGVSGIPSQKLKVNNEEETS